MLVNRNIKLCLRYDGTNYHGWQKQPDKITVSEVLEKAIQTITGEPIKIFAASRIDAGAHAYGQVVNFKTGATWDAAIFPKAINSILPSDIVVYDACDMPPDFHARFSARWRRYQYLILNSSQPSPFYRNYAYFYPRQLDIDKMLEGSKWLVGKHNFSSFCTRLKTIENHIRTVSLLLIEKKGKFISMDIIADAFLYGMIRSIVGILIDIARGKRLPEDVKTVLEAKDRKMGPVVSPACGLYLVEVGY